ncbi:MAG: hypothetical protein MHM6MM_001942 [Cercozoa sp. M6MM]
MQLLDSVLGAAKSFVRQGRSRQVAYNPDGTVAYDLDLSYITPRLIAMGVPCTGLASLYRNNLQHVADFLNTHHRDHFHIFNVHYESGAKYDYSKFNNRVLEAGWPDHQAPPLCHLTDLCARMQRYLDSHPENTAVIHCRAGKGRTGTLIAAFLLWTGKCATAQEALEFFAKQRADGSKGGTVRQPSQIRSVQYLEALVNNATVSPVSLRFRFVHFAGGLPEMRSQTNADDSVSMSWRPIVEVRHRNTRQLFSSCPVDAVLAPLVQCKQREHSMRMDTSVFGDLYIDVLHQRDYAIPPASRRVLVARAYFHTAFVQLDNAGNAVLVFGKKDLDAAFQNGNVPNTFRMEVHLSFLKVGSCYDPQDASVPKY